MNTLHLDVMTLNEILPDSEFKIEVHNMPAGEASSSISYSLTPSTHENLQKGVWASVDIPLTSLNKKEDIAQLVLSSVNMPDVYIDNIFFYQDENTVANEPTHPHQPPHTQQTR